MSKHHTDNTMPDTAVLEKKADFFIHIGLEKTGSTSIQTFLSSSTDLLTSQNTLYPQSLGRPFHNRLIIALQDHDKIDFQRVVARVSSPVEIENYLEYLTNNFKKELANIGPEKVILSCEHLSSRLINKQEIVRLKNLVSKYSHSIKILIYLRPQVGLLASRYSTYVLSGGIKTVSEYEKLTEPIFFDYYKLVTLWSRVFGKENMIVNLFCAYHDDDNYLLKDFCSHIGITYNEELKIICKTMNVSYSHNSLSILRRCNSILPSLRNPKAGFYRRHIMNIANIVTKNNQKKILFSRSFVTYLKKKYKESNRQVLDDFIVHSSTPSKSKKSITLLPG